MLCDNLEGWGGRRELQEGGDICTFTAYSYYSMVETNQTNPPIKKNLCYHYIGIKTNTATLGYIHF